MFTAYFDPTRSNPGPRRLPSGKCPLSHARRCPSEIPFPESCLSAGRPMEGATKRLRPCGMTRMALTKLLQLRLDDRSDGGVGNGTARMEVATGRGLIEGPFVFERFRSSNPPLGAKALYNWIPIGVEIRVEVLHVFRSTLASGKTEAQVLVAPVLPNQPRRPSRFRWCSAWGGRASDGLI